MTDIRIVREEPEGRRGRYVARIDGIGGEAEITFTRKGPTLISADHTGATETMKGTGAAAALVSFMVEDARSNGSGALPLCPYVRSQYRRHPGWADVMTMAPGREPWPRQSGFTHRAAGREAKPLPGADVYFFQAALRRCRPRTDVGKNGTLKKAKVMAITMVRKGYSAMECGRMTAIDNSAGRWSGLHRQNTNIVEEHLAAVAIASALHHGAGSRFRGPRGTVLRNGECVANGTRYPMPLFRCL